MKWFLYNVVHFPEYAVLLFKKIIRHGIDLRNVPAVIAAQLLLVSCSWAGPKYRLLFCCSFGSWVYCLLNTSLLQSAARHINRCGRTTATRWVDSTQAPQLSRFVSYVKHVYIMPVSWNKSETLKYYWAGVKCRLMDNHGSATRSALLSIWFMTLCVCWGYVIL